MQRRMAERGRSERCSGGEALAMERANDAMMSGFFFGPIHAHRSNICTSERRQSLGQQIFERWAKIGCENATVGKNGFIPEIFARSLD